MMQRSAPPTFPEALDDDDDDVTWALQTAAVQWKRGAHADAVEWLRRAIESAIDGGNAIRARELTQQTNALEAALRTGWVPRMGPSGESAVSGHPPVSQRSPASSRAPASARTPGSVRPPAAALPPFSAQPFPLRTPRPAPNPFAAPSMAGNPFVSGPAVNPFGGPKPGPNAAPARSRGGVGEYRAPELTDVDGYGELAVDIDVDGGSLAPNALRRDVSEPAELGDDEVVEEVEEFDELDMAALSGARRSAPRRPFVSAPELETGPVLDADLELESAELDEPGEEDDDRPTLPPTSSEKGPGILVPASLKDEIDELLGKPVRGSTRAGAPESVKERPRIPTKPFPDPKPEPSLPPPPEPVAEQVQEEEEPTERSLEAAPELTTPNAPFSELPPDETTERDLESDRASDPVPSSHQRARVSDSEPGTSPDLKVPFAALDSTPPTEPAPEPESAVSSSAAEADAPPTESQPTPPSTEAEADAPPTQPEPEPEPESKAATPRPVGPAEIAGIALSTVRGLEDLPDESQAQLAENAEIHVLGANEEVAGFGLALVLDGLVAVMPAVADVASARAGRGELVFSQGHLDDGIAMRVVAGPSGAQVATWPYAAFATAIEECPWVGDELKHVGDRFQALSGVAMGPMGDQLDDMLRGLVLDRCEVKRLLPGEVISQAGRPVPGMVIVGAGRLEIVDGEGEDARVLEELHPGDFLFAPQILQASPAPATARAGKGGALVLFAERKIAHELLMSVPPLLGIFAM